MRACAAPEPASVEALLSTLITPAGERIRYREEIRHPALPVPEIATGTMWVAADGALVRDQVTPRREISEIGDATVRLRKGPDQDPAIFPIPARLTGTVQAMRLVLTGGKLPQGSAASLNAGGMGWRLGIDLGIGPSATLFGCGRRIHGIETENMTGTRRTVRFLDVE